MQNILVVVDMQNDFINGSLGTKEAEAIVSKVENKIHHFSGKVFFTRDTHEEDYLETQEGKKLPVVHCIRGTKGWEICPQLKKFSNENIIDKPTFGSTELGLILKAEDDREKIESITFVGLCTDICVISNAMLAKAFLPETKIIVDASCCAGVTLESHRRALESMKSCQIEIENEEVIK